MARDIPREAWGVLRNGDEKEHNNLTPLQIMQMIMDAGQKWVDSVNAKGIEWRVQNYLDQQLNKIILSLIGLKEEYGRIEVDHRSDNPLRAVINEKARKAAEAWLDTNLPNLPAGKEIGVVLSKEYRSAYESTLRHAIQEQINKVAENQALKLITTLGFSAEEIAKLGRLKNPETPVPEPDKENYWSTKPILSSATCYGFVRIGEDGSITKDVDVPKTDAWVILQIKACIGDMQAVVVSNGHTWKPVTPSYAISGGALMPDAKVMSSFMNRDELIFHFMNEEDHKIIAKAVTDFMTSKDENNQ